MTTWFLRLKFDLWITKFRAFKWYKIAKLSQTKVNWELLFLSKYLFFKMGNCFDLPFCEPETGNFVTGPVCGYDNTCACIDAQTGEQSVSNEGVLLVSGVGLPQDFFGGWMRDSDFNCDKFSSDANSSPSLLEMSIPEDVLSQIAGLEWFLIFKLRMIRLKPTKK